MEGVGGAVMESEYQPRPPGAAARLPLIVMDAAAAAIPNPAANIEAI